MVNANGPIRTIADPDFRFELRPIVIPAGFELQTESLALWDKARTTRSFLQFAHSKKAKIVPTIEDIIEADKIATATLATVEAISDDVVTAVEQIFQKVTEGDKL